MLVLGYFGHLVSLGLTVFSLVVLALTAPGTHRRRRFAWTLASCLPMIPMAVLYKILTAEGGAFEPVWEQSGPILSPALWARRISWIDPIALGRRDLVPLPPGLDGPRGASVHLFVARRGDLAAEARAAGWYPVEIGGRIVHKPLIDHRRLGLAFGYPLCCVDFFLHHNDWPRQNTLAEAARRPTALSWQANSLPKKSPFMLLFHMPCTFDCEATREQARVTLEALREVDSAFAERIESFLRGLFLSISERAVFRLQGAREFGDDRVRYRSALDLRAAGSVQESWEERYHELLAAGDEVRVEEGDVHVLRQGRLVASLGCRCDRGVAEVPLLLDFR